MALKIKWNDDRVKAATSALLLIGRERLARGQAENLVADSLAEYRADPDGFKQARKSWAGARETGPLKTPSQVARYQQLVADTARVLERWTKAKRQFNSLLELDNALIATLADYR